MAKEPDLYLQHILEAIMHIEADTDGLTLEDFQRDRRAIQLVERNLEIISEASRHLADSLKDGTPGIPWRKIAGIGNVLRHNYMRVLPDVLWNTCRNEIPDLKRALNEITGDEKP